MTVVASKYARKKNETYWTERWATEALLRRFPVRGYKIWEPAAGNHHIADVLRDADAESVWTSDIATYDRAHDALIDFLRPESKEGETVALPADPDAIITNPPYGVGNHTAVKFARLALRRCPGMVALLLTAKFDFGSRRQDLFGRNPRFLGKIALVDRISWTGDGETGTEDHAWYVWGSRRTHPAPFIFYEGRQP